MDLFLGQDRKREIDHSNGIYFGDDGRLMLGDKQFDLEKDDAILVDNVRYRGTRGLYELIFMKKPDRQFITLPDNMTYKSIIMATNLYNRAYKEGERIRGNRGTKYTEFIKPLISEHLKRRKGLGLPVAMTFIKNFLNHQIPEEQVGFVKDKGTREQILNVRQIIEKSREFNKPVVLCFVDYVKAFDCVSWEKLRKVVKEMGVSEHLISLIRILYLDNGAYVKIDSRYANVFKTRRGRICYVCGSSEHVARDCPERKQPAVSKADGKSTTTTNLIQRAVFPKPYMITVKISSSKKYGKVDTYVIDAIIDSGSPISIIRDSIVKKEACSPIDEDISQFCGINGSRLEVLNIFYGQLEVQGVCTTIKFYIVPDNMMAYKVLLGRDFLACPSLRATVGDTVGN
ncbi:PREDICTED: uncharacterized protein LOC105447781 [Wasmannia auropunctata]|uniref:uncharacterized protein LOC105447781 n=1 Tax=Wasmannia auropunctata TaxID=64793 RepID=UPI0005EE349B|nr:PREDICTED: uncharacterized protein LOC105447781 [Wasmannia auropunctata]